MNHFVEGYSGPLFPLFTNYDREIKWRQTNYRYKPSNKAHDYEKYLA